MDQAVHAVGIYENVERRAADCIAGFASGVWHPEDLVRLEGTPWVIVSAMRSTHGRGALLAIDSGAANPAFEVEWQASAESGRRSSSAFDPHGIDARRIADGVFELLAVDHGDGEAIDRLTIDTRSGKPVVVEGNRIEQPIGTSGNAVASVLGNGFVMTSMFDPRDESKLKKFASAGVTGSVWRWTERSGWQAVGPGLSGANGIAVSPDGKSIVVSEWAARRVWRLSIGGTVEACVNVDFLPDNLRWSDNDTLLLAGQDSRPEKVFGCETRGEECPLAFKVVKVRVNNLKIENLLGVTHAEATVLKFGGATGALQVGNETWVGSFTGTQIARFNLGSN